MKKLSEDDYSFSDSEIEELLSEFAVALEREDIRSAEKLNGEWKANT